MPTPTYTELTAERDRLRTELSTLSEKMNVMQASDAAWDDARAREYTVMAADHARLGRDLDAINSDISASIEHYRGAPGRPQPDHRADAFKRYMARGDNGLAQDERDKFLSSSDNADVRAMGFTSSGFLLPIGPRMQTRSDLATGANAGEALTDTTTAPRVVEALAYYGGVGRAGQHFFTGTGASYLIPQQDDADEEGELLAAQGTSTTEDNLAFGSVEFGARTVSSKRIAITREMVQDAVIDIQNYAEQRLVRRIGRTNNRLRTVGTGSNQPLGVVTSARNGVTAGSRTMVTWQETTSLIYSIDRAYREGMESMDPMAGGRSAEMGGFTGYMISDEMERLLRNLLDGDNRPLWVPSVRDGVPSTYNGEPVIVNGHMAAPAQASIPMLYGNFSYYGIRNVTMVEIFRFMDSATMASNSVQCIAFYRGDSKPLGAMVGGRCQAFARLTMQA